MEIVTWLERPQLLFLGSPAPVPAWGSLEPLDLLLDPVRVALDVCEDRGQLPQGAENAPADHAHLDPSAALPADQRSPGVPL